MIPKVLHEHINTAFPANVRLVGVVHANDYVQISPRGSTMVDDDQHLALWERGKGSTNKKSGGAYDKVWEKLVQPEKERDPQKKGYAVLIKVERAEDLDSEPLRL